MKKGDAVNELTIDEIRALILEVQDVLEIDDALRAQEAQSAPRVQSAGETK